MPITKLNVAFICPSCKSKNSFTSRVYINEPKDLRDYIMALCPDCLEAILPKDIQFIACEPDSFLEGGLC